jgi:hypothetical protein
VSAVRQAAAVEVRVTVVTADAGIEVTRTLRPAAEGEDSPSLTDIGRVVGEAAVQAAVGLAGEHWAAAVARAVQVGAGARR